MRVCLVNPFFLPREGGIERRMLSLGLEYRRRGHEVRVVAAALDGSPGREEIHGIEVERVAARAAVPYDPPGLVVTGGARTVAEAVLRGAPDVVDFHYRWSPGFAFGMERVLRAGVPSVFTFHNVFGEGSGILRPFSWLNDSLMKLHISKYGRIVCVSEFVRRDLARRGFPGPRIAVCPNALTPPVGRVRDAGYALFLGRLVMTKGLEHLLFALDILRRRTGREVESVIAGDGPRRDRLAGLAARLGLARVRFTGRVTEDEKWALLRGCRLSVLPSVAESFGLAALEAMSCAKPVVAARVGGLPEVVGDAGILVPARDPGALAAAISRLWDDEALRSSLGVAARARASRFSWSAAADRMLGIYGEAVEYRDAQRAAGARSPAGTAAERAPLAEPFSSDS